jgi:hypothetical protein
VEQVVIIQQELELVFLVQQTLVVVEVLVEEEMVYVSNAFSKFVVPSFIA